MSGRKPIVGGNWKMHLVSDEATTYCQQLLAGPAAPLSEVVIFPSAPLLSLVASSLDGSWAEWGGQDLHPEPQGAHTGDTSGAQLSDAGCTWVLCGHSERRQDHGESDELVGRKVDAACASNLIPMICVGETLEQRQSGRTFEVIARQLNAALRGRPNRFAVAYEPVWAIGTGETATPEIAQEAHQFLRETLADLLGERIAAVKRILYGGSVNPTNAAELASLEDIDGFLVGGASLDPEKFLSIIRCWG
jgi:triosephosphate isomerase